ncbi:gliding motility-associated C-terminal domain-containing protein [Formosa haliotis]|uniref:T9SS type B sorting domain-containing protein n=1 Tax=Formosa haliotis TaxID=1555194 RepID=UPI0008252F67|nr:gliding motility-associated C-terminal domain-containing protein [Formosa haliotis]
MKSINLPNKHCLFVGLFIWLFFTVESYSQITILTPTLDFTQACASTDFNEYQVTFSFYPAQNLGSDNTFLIELSDGSGSFDAPTVLETLTNTTSPVRAKFKIPETASGTGYKIRIKSTDPEFTSPESSAFSAHYAIHNQPFSINSYDSNVSLCQGETYTLTIDNNNTPASPVYYPELTYKWYKNFLEISGETTSQLTVSESGSYYCIVDYGNCVMDSYSNIVDVNVISDIKPIISSENNANAICNGGSTLLTSNFQDSSFTFTWFKDNSPIANSDAPTYNATQPGLYHVTIDNGSCDFVSNAIDIDLLDIDISINNNQDEVLLIPGNTIQLNTTTTATAPTYTWFKDGSVITGSSESNISVAEPGVYRVSVAQNSPCTIEKEASITVYAPLYYELAITALNDYEACNSAQTTLSVSKFDAITDNAVIDLLGNTQAYSFTWYNNNIEVSGETSSSIHINSASENGSYTLDVNLGNSETVISNALDINLASEVIEISNNTALCEGNSVVITSSVTNSNYSYQWYKNDVLITGENTFSITTTNEGDYHLDVLTGDCTSTSNIISLVKGQISITSETPESDVLLPGTTKLIEVQTDAVNPTYSWYKDDVALNNENQSTLTITEGGIYKVTVAQTADCITEVSKTFTISTPTDAVATISTDADFKTCSTSPTQLSLSSLEASTANGTIDLLEGDTSTYSFQWLKDGATVANATSLELDIQDFTQNGTYNLVSHIPGFGDVISNNIEVQLSSIEAFSITSEGTLCDTNSQVVLTTDNPHLGQYSYAWYKEGDTQVLETTPELTTQEAGMYYLEISDANCTVASNSIELNYFDDSQVITSHPSDINLYEGTSLTLSAEGASTYIWKFNDAIISETWEVKISEAGIYTLTASVGSCETVREFNVNIIPNNAIAIPNIVSLNGDGYNDTWALPSTYLNENTEITIYEATGKEVLKTTNYSNNWPATDFKFSTKSPVFYYTIKSGNEITNKGSITIIK